MGVGRISFKGEAGGEEPMREAGEECSVGGKQETGVTEAKGLKKERRGGDKGR